MPLYDRHCDRCGQESLDKFEQREAENPPCECGGTFVRFWKQGSANNVIGDEIDVYIKHGLCHADGTPRRFRSRIELRRAEKAAGLTNYVTSERTPGPNRHRHTVS